MRLKKFTLKITLWSLSTDLSWQYMMHKTASGKKTQEKAFSRRQKLQPGMMKGLQSGIKPDINLFLPNMSKRIFLYNAKAMIMIHSPGAESLTTKWFMIHFTTAQVFTVIQSLHYPL